VVLVSGMHIPCPQNRDVIPRQGGAAVVVSGRALGFGLAGHLSWNRVYTSASLRATDR